MANEVKGPGGDSSITYAEIHSELEEVRRILVDLTGTVERLSSIVSTVRPQPGSPAPTAVLPSAAPGAAPSSPPPVAPNPVDAILGDTFGRPT